MKKQQKRILIISAYVLAVILVSLFFVNINTGSKTTTFYDKDLGFIQISVSKCGFICKLFNQQTFTIPKTSYNVGESVTGTTSGACFGTYDTTLSGHGKLKIGGAVSSVASYTFTKSGNWKTTVSYTPTKEGTYTLTNCWDCQDGIGELCDAAKTITVVQKATSCAPDDFVKKQRLYDQEVGKIGLGGYYCELYNRETLSNGNCVVSQVCKSYITYCESGYVVAGTDSQDYSGSSLKNCVKVTVPSDTGCNSDVTETCNDGFSTIVVQKCTNGQLTDTSESCPEAPTDGVGFSVDNGNTGSSNNTSTQTNQSNTGNNGDTTVPATDWVLIGLIAGFVIALLILVYVFAKRK